MFAYFAYSELVCRGDLVHISNSISFQFEFMYRSTTKTMLSFSMFNFAPKAYDKSFSNQFSQTFYLFADYVSVIRLHVTHDISLENCLLALWKCEIPF